MTPNDDPYLAVLMGIASELTAIRQELQRQNASQETNTPAGDEYTCQSCDESVPDEQAARRHAEDEHNAPDGAWRSIMQPAGADPDNTNE